MHHLFAHRKMREVVLSNRIGIPPMCLYFATGDKH